MSRERPPLQFDLAKFSKDLVPCDMQPWEGGFRCSVCGFQWRRPILAVCRKQPVYLVPAWPPPESIVNVTEESQGVADPPNPCGGCGKKMPGLATQAKNFIGAAARHLATGAQKASDEQMAERLAICASCEEYCPENKRCYVCGCFAEIKASWKEQTCPRGKWPVDPGRNAQ